ncbi:unnamed protein product [Leptidea sinapis]|uniref:Hedgehog N-terminal signalling domain-containing protein n=1 Tax=Leptidea sinapis TaxID=189913 RepID=A0A5E4PQ93_9NEOP|nr:unnamed protein product [Leptidea sinapis]
MRLSLVLLWLGAATACGPGRGFTRRHGPRRITPLVFNQHDPNISENSKTASGPPEGRITRDDDKFRDLVPNYNPDIEFRDEEGTGADRLMTQRLSTDSETYVCVGKKKECRESSDGRVRNVALVMLCG